MKAVSSKNLYCKIVLRDKNWNTFYELKSESYQLEYVNMLNIKYMAFFFSRKVDKK